MSGNTPIPRKINAPYGLTSLGYVQSADDPSLFTNPKGHPFYPVHIKPDIEYHIGECTELIASSAYEAALQATLQ